MLGERGELKMFRQGHLSDATQQTTASPDAERMWGPEVNGLNAASGIIYDVNFPANVSYTHTLHPQNPTISSSPMPLSLMSPMSPSLGQERIIDPLRHEFLPHEPATAEDHYRSGAYAGLAFNDHLTRAPEPMAPYNGVQESYVPPELDALSHPRTDSALLYPLQHQAPYRSMASLTSTPPIAASLPQSLPQPHPNAFHYGPASPAFPYGMDSVGFLNHTTQGTPYTQAFESALQVSPATALAALNISAPKTGAYGGPRIPGTEQFMHVPIFRDRKTVYVKKQREGCCGCLNTTGYYDNPGGFLCFPLLNVYGCCDRQMVLRVKKDGEPYRVKRRRQFRHPWE